MEKLADLLFKSNWLLPSVLLIFTAAIVFFTIALIKQKNIEIDVKQKSLRVTDSEKKPRKKSSVFTVADILALSSYITSYRQKKDEFKRIETQSLISACIRFTNTRLNSLRLESKEKYKKILRQKGQEILPVDNFKMIIFGFYLEQIEELCKDILCRAIREDHFEKKTDEEINALSEKCVLETRNIFNSLDDIDVDMGIVREFSEEMLSKLKKAANQSIENAIDKYKDLASRIKNFNESEEKAARNEMELRFPVICEKELLDVLFNESKL